MSDISFSEGTIKAVLQGLHESAGDISDSLFVGRPHDGEQILLARFEDAVVGYLASTATAQGLLVWEHFVVPDFRDRGIGRRLLLEVAKRTPPMALITIDPTGDFVISQVAAYYARLGFSATTDDRFRISVKAHQVVDAIGEQAEEQTTLETIVRRKPTVVITIAPDAAISDALTLLVDNKIGSVVVSEDGNTIDGILSERDVVVGLNAGGASILSSRVRDHMTADVISAEVSDDVAHVMEVVTVKRLRHLPVTDQGQLVGVVSVGDLLVFRMREHDMRRDNLPYRERT